MSFWKSLFGSGRSTGGGTTDEPVRTLEHDGYLIEARPYLEEGQYQVAGTISKEIGGERRVHRFVRADRAPGIDDAAEMAIRKGRQIIEQNGDRMFEPR